MSTFTPIDDQVLIHRFSAKRQTALGMHLPDISVERPLEGTVLAVGPGRRDGDVVTPCIVKTGDHVLFRKYGGTEVTFDNLECLVVREHEILGVITDG